MAQSRFHALAYAGMSGDFSPVTCIAAIAHATFMTSCVLSSSMRAPTASVNATHAPGDGVILTGWGIGERQDGGYATHARAEAGWLVRQPAGTDAAWAMSVGTAGFTAMLAVMALEDADVRPGDGEVLAHAPDHVQERCGFEAWCASDGVRERDRLRRRGRVACAGRPGGGRPILFREHRP